MKRGPSSTIFDVSAKRIKLNGTQGTFAQTRYRTLPPAKQRGTKTRHTDYVYCRTCKMSHAQRSGQGMHPAVSFLLQQDGNEDNQKSDAWLRARCSKATGTFYASCLPKNHSSFNEHTTRTGAFLGKLNLALPFKGNDATRHGERFEDTAIEVYRHLVNNDTIQSFGLLEHPYASWLGASPDGITNGGIAIEVKCPYFRWLKKDGLYPMYYYPQPQLVMDIAGVEVAHFIQFKPPVIHKVKKGTKMIRDRYTHAMKEIPIYEKVYEDNVERMLMHGHDKSRYKEPMVISVVEVLRNRKFFRSNLKHVESMWKLVTQVYKDNLVPLGNANMIRALHSDRMSLSQFVVRLHMAFRREGLMPIDYVRLVKGDGPLRDMSTIHDALGGTRNLKMGLSRFNLGKAMQEEIPVLGKLYNQCFGETALAALGYDFTKSDPPPYYSKAKVKVALKKALARLPTKQHGVLERLAVQNKLNQNVHNRMTLALHLDSPIVDDLTAFCTANNVPFVSVTEEGQTEPVTTRAFDLDKVKHFVKRKNAVPLAEKLLDFEEGDDTRIEPETIGTTIYYRCGDYAYNPRNLHPTNLNYFGGKHGLPKATCTTVRSSPRGRGATPIYPIASNATRSIAPGRVAQPTDMMALFSASQNPSSASSKPQLRRPSVSSTASAPSLQPLDMMAQFQASLKSGH